MKVLMALVLCYCSGSGSEGNDIGDDNICLLLL